MSPDDALTITRVQIERWLAAQRRDLDKQIPERAARRLCDYRHGCTADKLPCRLCRRDIDRALHGQQTIEEAQ